jgi:hypothetical protein
MKCKLQELLTRVAKAPLKMSCTGYLSSCAYNFKNNCRLRKNNSNKNINMNKQDHNTGKFAEDLGAHRDNTGLTQSTATGGDFGPGRGAENGEILDIHKAYKE